ncbi:flagellin [Filobacillus milosensis]|uniref:Flagellin n=1 Tax=Filobacillus milosensis TaxID=94137 RepID=A0A4Y8IRS1_9BACI|nr:flagellin [Filobacillus milosensis]TFB24375.1 flagellin [Filobacillus milosensis]
MRINHNIAALNTYRQLSNANNAQQGSMEKLSSGLRINRAGDDAAGLAISEKMRGQIRGLQQAERNAQDGISLIQTAEGALNETHSILQRMRELAVQASNDTNTDTDRFELQKEINQLTEEITRIGDNTEFNTKNLLDGSFSGSFQIGANEGQSVSLDIGDMTSDSLNVTADSAVSVVDKGSTDMTGSSNLDKLAGGSYSIEVATDGSATLYADDGTSVATGSVTDTASSDASVSFSVSGSYTADGSSSSVSITLADTDTSSSGVATTAGTINVNVLEQGQGISVMDQNDADSAITSIQSALDRVSAERSKLGAYQNRLDHSINNLGTSAENLTAAESRIRDVDMAKEMMNQTKSSILAQASQAMLAQANQQPQGVLQLLR